MLRINQVKLKCNESTDLLSAKIAKMLNIRDFQPSSLKIVKESVDARKKPDIKFIYTVDFECENEEKLLAKAEKMKGVNLTKITPISAPDIIDAASGSSNAALSEQDRPVIVGFGPCGIFAALTLAESGLRPIVIERGRRVEERTHDVEHFWETGELDVRSNVQFGEGGAGTFSDGKLTTGIKDIRIAKVNEEFIKAGADASIAYRQMPHIGTDVLRDVVKNIRNKIISLGGEIRFESEVTAIQIRDGKLVSLTVSDTGSAALENSGLKYRENASEEYELRCSRAVFAPGNSARDTFRMMYAAGVHFEFKPFSVGVRIEHPQSVINESQYGKNANDSEGRLGAAAYKLSHHCKDGRGVYTFCMCPGGVVVGAASEVNSVVTNGMSSFARDGENANSALLADVRYEDCVREVSRYMESYSRSTSDSENIPEFELRADSKQFQDIDPLLGLRFQEILEHKAYELGGGTYYAPVQTVGAFMCGEQDGTGGSAKMPGKSNLSVKPTYRPGVRWADVSECLPEFVSSAIREAIPYMARKLKAFDMDEAVITAVETRSSSPVRIPRTESYESVSVHGLYPAGEGAGYAGGIMSAAVDGIRIAEKIIDTVTIATDEL